MADKMQKLNLMGTVPSQEGGNKPQTNVPYGGAQVVNVTYGHNGSGKLYSYYGVNKRAGDIVTPEVTHPKSGKTYKTLAVVQSTHNAGKGIPTMDYLQGKQAGSRGQMISKPTAMKWIGKTDQQSLPGYYKGWEKDAQAAYDLKNEVRLSNIPEMQKISLMREVNSMRRQDIKNRKKGE